MTTLTQPQQTTPASRVEYITPRVNLHQDGDSYTLEAEMPGVGKDGVEVTVEDGKLTLVGHRKSVEPSAQLLHRERSRKAYRRVYDLDPSIDAEKIEARIDQGLLTVRLHKAETAKPRKITIS